MLIAGNTQVVPVITTFLFLKFLLLPSDSHAYTLIEKLPPEGTTNDKPVKFNAVCDVELDEKFEPI